jgi:allantoinase
MTFTALKSKNILTPTGIREGAVIIEGSKIIDVVSSLSGSFDGKVEELNELVVMPGLIDCHVHINEPGRTEWEGFETATKAAAANGITCLVEMPLNATPVTTNSKNFQIKVQSAQDKLTVNCGFYGGVIPTNSEDLEQLLNAGVFGLKAFLTHSGINDFPNSSEADLRKALTILKKFKLPLLVHCELDAPIPDSDYFEKNPRSYKAYLNSRPKSFEINAVKLMIDLCRETNSKVHIVHISTAEALSLIADAKAEGLPLTAETCPHYLFFDSESIADGDTSLKCAPPIRECSNNKVLWDGLRNGTLDFVVSDHSPAPPDLKEIESGNFKKAWGGIASLQFLLPATWTAAKKNNIALELISNWLSINQAIFLNLDKSIGKIEKNYDADFVIWDPNQKFIVEEGMILHRHKITPYLGKELFGVVHQTYLKGVKIFDSGKFLHLNKGTVLYAEKSYN